MAGHTIDMVGFKSGMLTATEYSGLGFKNLATWKCICDCGNTVNVTGHDLRRYRKFSCGCSQKNRHGMCGTPEYKTWANIKQRCVNHDHKQYKDYGGRGITVCERWLNSVESFIEDMGHRPSGLSIDRINNDDGYHCGKCEECLSNGWVANSRWATTKQQANNRRK